MESTARCPNCDHPATGAYCSHCGQSQARTGSTFVSLLREALEEISDADSRLLRTAGTILFLPGRATRDYLACKRARYLPPFRTYLIFNVILYFMLDVVLQSPRVQIDFDAGPGTIDAIELGETVVSYVPQLGFVMLPIAAFLLKLLYLRRPIAFGDHLVAALHIKAGIAGWMIVALVVYSLVRLFELMTGIDLESSGDLIFEATQWAIIGYVLFSLHVIYGGKVLLNLVRGISLLVSYLVFATIGILVLAWLVTRFAV